MALYPKATLKLIPPGPNDPRIKPRIGILHVDAGGAASLYKYFRDRSGGVESHGHIRYDGSVEQYRDTDYEADANYKANPFASAWETQGKGDGEWTPEQIQAIKEIMLWERYVHKIPLRKVTSWDDPVGGWGYHVLFGAPGKWTPVAKSCPGALRIKQFEEILVPWMKKQDRFRKLVRMVPAPWNRFQHITPYYKNNSEQGILQSKEIGRIDLDFLRSKDGIWVLAHWNNLDTDGFRWTSESMEKGFCTALHVGSLTHKKISDLEYKVLRTLRTKDGYKILNQRRAFDLAARNSIDVEAEFKFTPTKEQIEQMKRNAIASYGEDYKKHVQVKMLPLFNWRTGLYRAKKYGGFTTFRLRVKYPWLMPWYVDFYRR